MEKIHKDQWTSQDKDHCLLKDCHLMTHLILSKYNITLFFPFIIKVK